MNVQTCMKLVLFFLLVLFPLSSGPSAQSPEEKSATDPQREFFETKCQKCHSLERIKEAHLTREKAKEIVDRMKNKPGADISQPEADRIYDYLGNYLVIPPSPPVAPVPMR